MMSSESTITGWKLCQKLHLIEGVDTKSVNMDYESSNYDSPNYVSQFIPSYPDGNFVENCQGGSRSFSCISKDIQNEVDGVFSNSESPLTPEQLMKQQYTDESDLSSPETIEPRNLQDIIELYHTDKEPYNESDAKFMNGQTPTVSIIDTVSPCHHVDFGLLTLDSPLGGNGERPCKSQSKRKNSPKNMTKKMSDLPSTQSKKKKLYELDPMDNKALDKKRKDAVRAKNNREKNKNNKKELELLLTLERQTRQGLEAEVAELRSKLAAVEKAMAGKVPIKTGTSVCQGQQTMVIYVPYASSDVNTMLLTPSEL